MADQKVDGPSAEAGVPYGVQVMEALYGFLRRFVSYPSVHAAIAHSLWIVHAHLMDQWESTPRLAFLSPEPGSGKTRALEITELLVPNPVSAVNVTPAYLFRKVGTENVTILFDEIDTVFGPKARPNEELRGLLNAGHRRGAMAGRCVVKGKQIETEEIPAYAAVALAGLGWLPDTLSSRSVIIRMQRRGADEPIDQFRRRLHFAEGYSVKQLIEAWARRFTVEWPQLPPQIRDRDADVWEPLVAIADAVGGDWPSRARAAAVTLVTASKDIEPSLGVRLLADLHTVFGGSEEMATADILTALHELPESPWRNLKGEPLNDRALAHRLRQYGVKSCQIWFAQRQLRGYRRKDLVDVWGRYLAQSSPSLATNVTSVTQIEAADAALVTAVTAPGEGRSEMAGATLCASCRDPGEDRRPLLEVYDAGRPVRLHGDCIEIWSQQYPNGN
jgi:hypothetical protein